MYMYIDIDINIYIHIYIYSPWWDVERLRQHRFVRRIQQKAREG